MCWFCCILFSRRKLLRLAHTHGKRNLTSHYRDIMDGMHMAVARFGKYNLHSHFSLNNNVPAGDARDTDSIRGLGRFPGGGYGNLLRYSWKIPPTK